MAVGRLSCCSATLVVFMIILLLLQTPAQTGTITSFTSSLAVASKLDVKHFPGRNSGLHRRPRALNVPPSLKLQTGLKLVNTSLTASFFVILAGDVSLNPGPIRDPCVLCAKGCRMNQKAVQCDECDRWFHAKCMNMKNHEYFIASDLTANWSCTDCLFPGPLFPNNSDCNTHASTASNDLNDPEIHLIRGLKIAHLNINKPVNKVEDVRELFSTYAFDVLAWSETWLSSNITDNEISI